MVEPVACPHIVIVGLMGAGKSTTGSALAAKLAVRHVDSDADIERLTGRTGAEFAAAQGVGQLHQLEAAVLLGALVSGEPSVISAASSTVEDPLVRSILPSRARVVRLKLSISETMLRQATAQHRRPMSSVELSRLAERREPYFDELADLSLDGMRPTSELVAEVVAEFTSR